jgi:hypothetical protein
MWMVEVNVLGRRFTHTVSGRPDALRHAAHLPQWRQWKPRHPRAAA